MLRHWIIAPSGDIANHNNSLFLQLLNALSHFGARRGPPVAAERPYLILGPRLLENVPKKVGHLWSMQKILLRQNRTNHDTPLMPPIHDPRDDEWRNGEGAIAIAG